MDEGTAPARAAKKLEITHTVGDAFTSITDNFRAFLKIAAVPGLIFIFIGLAPFLPLLLWQAGYPGLAGGLSPALDVAALLISYFAGIYFAVAWHRHLLLGGAPRVFSAWHKPHWRFLLYTILFMVLPWVAVMLVTFTLIAPGIGRGLHLGWPGTFLLLAGFAVGLWLWLRISLVYPGAAVGAEGYGVKQAWQDTRGNVWRLVLVMLLVFLPVGIVLWIASFLVANTLIYPQGIACGAVMLILYSVIFLAIQIWLLGVTVSIFSSAFRQLATWAAPSSPASPATQAGGFAG